MCELPVHEYSPNEIKQAVVGRGHATKDQVQHMVKVLLSMQGTLRADAADALGVALCHGHTRQSLSAIAASGARGARSGRWL
jgi:crossover junction endodeoxyribonuclease RuvC